MLNFKEKLEEFKNMGEEKFLEESKIKFKDGTYAYYWFSNNRYIRDNDKDFIKILEEYNRYITLKKQELYLKRLEEFEKLNYDKFNNSCDIRFTDGALVNSWFNNNKLKIQNGTDSISKSIMSQKSSKRQILEQKSKSNYLAKLKKFEKADQNKFNSSYKMKFSDGTYMTGWFRNNKLKIENSTDSISKSIMSQYYSYSPLRRLIKLSFLDKLKEFEEASQDKFDASAKMKFSDDTSMLIWFKNNKYNIEMGENELAKSIMEQYLLMKSQKKNYNKKLLEFYSADLSKFNIALLKKFEDGTIMSYWYYNNRNIIANSNDDISKEIVRQHEEYINGNKPYIDDSLNDIKNINK